MTTRNNEYSTNDLQARTGSLSKTLILWFLLLSLTPMSLLSWLGYQQARNNLTQAAQEKLEQSAVAGVQFIHNWFNYRLADLNNQAESQNNSLLLESLVEGLQLSEKPASEYVKSFDWVKRVGDQQNNLITLNRRYDYIYDTFLIDSVGNILYSVEEEYDLGSNLITGPYAETRLAHSVRATLGAGGVNFSGLENYTPSNNIVSGFISAPLLDKSGDIQGVFTIQLSFDRIFEALNASTSDKSSLHHYLTTPEGDLRTPLRGDNWKNTLTKQVETAGFKLWQQGLIVPHLLSEDHYQATREYIGPYSKGVIGTYHQIKLANIDWVLVSEIESTEALASAQWLGKVTLGFTLLTALFVIIIAFVQARRITKPLIALSEASKNVTAGNLDQQVSIDSNDEIGLLADAFNQMVSTRQKHVQELEHSTCLAQQALAELDEQKFALDQHAIVTTTDTNGTITYVNRRFCEVSGFSADEVLGNNHRVVNSGYHSTEYWRKMYQTLSNGTVWKSEVCNKTKEGHFYWVDTTIIPFKNDLGKPVKYISIRTNITQRKSIEAQLINSKETAEAATMTKSRFLSTMSHEIRTPMNGVIGMAQLLQDTQLTDEQKDYLGTIVNSGNNLLEIINSVLDFSKLDAEMVHLESIPFDLERLCLDCMKMVAGNALRKELEFIFDYQPDCPRYFKGDPSRVRQILMNLLGNAAKFTPKGHIRLAVSCKPEKIGEKQILLEIEDTGIGLKPDSIKYIFEEFTQADQATTREFGGTGLGLAITKKLVKLMGAEIGVNSVLGKGTRFWISGRLPLAELPQPLSLTPIEELRILFIDNNLNNRRIFERSLRHMGTQPSIIEDPDQVISTLEQAIKEGNPFKVAIIDHKMPKMSGLDLGVKIREKSSLADLKLLILSSAGQKGDVGLFKQAGFNAYLNKLTRYEILRATLSNMLEHETGQPPVTQHTIEDAWASTNNNTSFEANILLVDDVLPNQIIARKFLERLGVTVDVASDGEQAIDCYRNSHYDLILMDCRMPVMDGYEATRAIRNLEKQQQEKTALPIIALTANVTSEDKLMCLQAGMDDVVTKPFKREDLSNCLKKWLPEPTSS